VHWYCLHTKPQKEEQVVSFCAAQLGLETYYPRLRQYRNIRRKRRLVIGPLFPRYLFCRFDPGIRFRAVRYAPEVVDIVSKGCTPTMVSPSLIEGLREWAGEEVDLLDLQPSMQIGDRVEITNGPMQGLSGTIVKESKESVRITILLSFLQDGAQLNLERSNLRLIA
jgi:transcription antitermination factor NusG